MNIHVYRDRIVGSELCVFGMVETIEHFWLHCPNYTRQRRQLVSVFSSVLSRPVVPTLAMFLAWTTCIRSRRKQRSVSAGILTYLCDTGRFDVQRGVVVG